MQQVKHSRKKRIFAITLGAAVALGAIAGALYYKSNQALARNSLSNVEKIREGAADGSPFVILEVVNDKSDASIGYLVGGEEPVDSGKSIKDMPSKEERTAKMSSYSVVSGSKAEELQNEGAFSYSSYGEPPADGADFQTMSIRGVFKEDSAGAYGAPEGGGYSLLSSRDDASSIYVDDAIDYDYLNSLGIRVCRNQVVYSESESGGYGLSLSKIVVDTVMPYKFSDGDDDGLYTWQYFTASEIPDADGFVEGQYVYTGSSDYPEYKGYIWDDGGTLKLRDSSGSDTEVGDVDFTSENYYSVTEDTSAGSDVYRISSVTSGITGGYSRATAYAEIPEGTYSESNCPSSQYNDFYYLTDPSGSKYVYNGAGAGHSFTADYTQDEYEQFSFEGGFVNNEWFKDYVLDLDGDASKNRDINRDDVMVDVVTITLSELDADYLDKADLVYMAGGYSSDITAELAIDIVKRVKNENLPIIVEDSILTVGNVGDLNGHATVNLNGLAIWMRQKDNRYSIDDVEATGWSSSELKTGLSWSNLWDNMYAGDNGDYSFVNGSVFYNDISAAGSVVAADFNTKFIDSKSRAGFSELLSEIESENLYIEKAGETKLELKASKATAIRHIINAGDARIVFKTGINVLDLEPYDCTQYGWDYREYKPTADAERLLKTVNWHGYDNTDPVNNLTTDYFDKGWFISNVATQFSSNEAKDKVSVDMQGTAEFIGREEILNEKYDLIYIGMDTTMMYTDYTGKNGTKSNKTRRNDSDMDGLVYSHVGDKFWYNDHLARGSEDGNIITSGEYRTSGNDITYNKYRELKNYVEAGYAVMLSDDINAPLAPYEPNHINDYRVDKSTYLYKFLSEVAFKKDDSGNYLYYGKNVFYKKDLIEKANAETFAKYINISGLKITASHLPEEYVNAGAEPTYLSMKNGVYSLDYTVKLENESQVGSDTTYDCKLYIDQDADGKFENHERLTGVEIAGESTDDDGRYHLSTGKTYDISRQLPDEYVGFISWKLVFTQNSKNTESANYDESAVKSAISGFTAVKARNNNKPTIKILQIKPYIAGDPNPSSDNWQTFNLDLKSNTMQQLYDAILDFNVDVTQIEVDDYINVNKYGFKADENGHFDYLCQYDMIVLGFTDVYEFRSVSNQWNENLDKKYQQAVNGIRQYAISGRSVLFTHDLTNSARKQNNDRSMAGWYFTMYLRDIMGMDRFGTTVSDINNAQYIDNNYESKYDYAEITYYNNGNNRTQSVENLGFTNFNVLNYHDRDNNNHKFGLLDTVYMNLNNNYWGLTAFVDTQNDSNRRRNTVIEQNNAGQITTYPYNIDTSFIASQTHPQYYQLNLDTDSTDDIADDVTVWYTISNTVDTKSNNTDTGVSEFTRDIPMDARNNYYIYSKGNVMYTGAGHTPVDRDMEQKLFVNTLVAAYSSGTHAPKVLFKENPRDTAATVTSTYIPYDKAYMSSDSSVGAVLDDTLTVNFKTANNNFANSQQALHTKYYVRVPAGTGGALKIGEKYYKQITPSSFTHYDGNGVATPHAADTLENYEIYQAKFSIAQLGITFTGTHLDEDGNIDPNSPAKINTDGVELYVRIGTEALKDENVDIEPSYESMNKLAVYTLELKELR